MQLFTAKAHSEEISLVASDGEKRQWMIEPQAQIAYNSYSADDHSGLDFSDLSIIGPDGHFRR